LFSFVYFTRPERELINLVTALTSGEDTAEGPLKVLEQGLGLDPVPPHWYP